MRILRQIRLNKSINREFKVQASAMDVELATLHDMAISEFIKYLKTEKKPPIFLQQPNKNSAITTNVRVSEAILKDVEVLANKNAGLVSVSVPAFIYTALMHWANKHEFLGN